MNSYPTTCRTGVSPRTRTGPENRHPLQLHEVWRPSVPASGTITCTAGRCWLTRIGDPDDYLLESGMSFAVHSRDGVVVQALAEGTVLVVE